MSDVIVFGFGVFVTFIVAIAVGFLFWGASNETSLPEAPAERAAAPRGPHYTFPDSVAGPKDESVTATSATV